MYKSVIHYIQLPLSLSLSLYDAYHEDKCVVSTISGSLCPSGRSFQRQITTFLEFLSPSAVSGNDEEIDDFYHFYDCGVVDEEKLEPTEFHADPRATSYLKRSIYRLMTFLRMARMFCSDLS